MGFLLAAYSNNCSGSGHGNGNGNVNVNQMANSIALFTFYT